MFDEEITTETQAEEVAINDANVESNTDIAVCDDCECVSNIEETENGGNSKTGLITAVALGVGACIAAFGVKKYREKHPKANTDKTDKKKFSLRKFFKRDAVTEVASENTNDDSTEVCCDNSVDNED